MVKKSVLCLLALLLMSGCASQAAMSERLTAMLNKQAELEPLTVTNMSKYYYSYYLPSDVGRVKGNDLSGVYLKDGTKFVMNLDASQIIIDEYYTEESEAVVDELTMETTANGFLYKGSFKDAESQSKNYTIRIEKISDKIFYLELEANSTTFYSLLPYAQIPSMVNCMMTMMRSVKVEKALILNDFSLKSATDTHQQNLDYLNEEVPIEGYIKDLVGN